MEKPIVLDSLSEDEQGIVESLIMSFEDFFTIHDLQCSVDECHIKNTPSRTVDALLEMFSGCWEDPKHSLDTTFDEVTYDEIIYVNDISFVSMCAHHCLPFVGKMHFGYLPNKKIVGLSKIPRLIRTLSRRPQVQEKLTCEIVDTFQEVVEPIGCGLVVEAYHLCVMVRGIESIPAYTKTVALRGTFKSTMSAKQEFLNGVRKTTSQVWP